MSSKEKLLESISMKLDIIIGSLLQLRTKVRAEREDILALSAAGLGAEEIARILGKTSNSIYIFISRSRRKQKLV